MWWLLVMVSAGAGAPSPGDEVPAAQELPGAQDLPGAQELPATPETPATEAAPPPGGGEDLEVTIRPSVREARQQVERALGDMGYAARRTRDGRDVYLSETRWKPRVVVDRDGWMMVKRRPCVVVNGEGRAADPDTANRLSWAPCLLQPWACVSCRGQMMSKAKLDGEKRRIVDAVHDEMRAYGDALADRALDDQLAVELPAALRAIWTGPGSPEARRAALIDVWRSRTCTEWGQRARDAIERWLAVHVQTSADPLTEAERATEACGRRLDGRVTGP